MKSEFVREQKRYTRNNLKSIFSCSDSDVIRIIKKLKSYGILKTVKNEEVQMELSDLAEEDIVVSDEDEVSSKYLYVFTFVGLIIVEGCVLKCYPKYFLKNASPTEELKQILKVLRKYNAKEQIIRMYNDEGKTTSFNRLAAMVELLNDYFENGIYTNMETVIEINGAGEIHWDKTIHSTYPIISKARPYYVELHTRRTVNNETDFFTRLHETMLTMCSKELGPEHADLCDLLGVEGVNLTDEVLEDFGDEEFILGKLANERNLQFNTRKQKVLNILEALISDKGAFDDVESFSLYGTNCFNLVWEKVCAEVLNNQLHIPIKELGLKSVVLPEGAQYSAEDELISVIEKPKWMGYREDGSEFEKEASKTLVPDLITIYQCGQAYDFIIFDAKYYTVQLEVEENLKGQPGVNDVIKQYLYQLAYKDFVRANGFKNVKNCFLMPTEEDGIDGVIKKGAVKMDMLAAFNLEHIQVRQLSAKKIFSCYLSNQKFDIKKLNL